MQIKNLSSVGPSFILIGFVLTIVFSIIYASCTGNLSSCGYPSGFGIISFLFSLGTTMILSGAILTAAGHIAEHFGTCRFSKGRDGEGCSSVLEVWPWG